MNKELCMNELGRLLEEIRRFTKLNGNWTKEAMSGKDMAALKEIAVSTQEMIDIITASSDEPDKINLISSIGQFISAIEESDPDKLTESCHKLEAVKTEYEQEKIRVGKIQKVFQIDLREMEFHEAKGKALQDLVDLDLKLYGEVSAITLEVLEVQHYQLSGDNKVQERKEEPEKQQPVEEPEEQKTAEPEKQKEQSCKAYAYMKIAQDKKQKPKVIYGNSPEDIITTLQGWNMGRTDKMKFHTCYISSLDVRTNEYTGSKKYDVATGIDITPIYLNLPHMSREEFLKTVDQLKKDGAKYNPIEKKFYVTRQNDLNKFSKYLPIMADQTPSILAKISQNKAKLEAGKNDADVQFRERKEAER
ncbi:MAG: hypothetical protein NC429_00935 [Lachnospiraceae bacterium]|nr:hypothetical protein [Lachnospiraceae bacterium]